MLFSILWGVKMNRSNSVLVRDALGEVGYSVYQISNMIEEVGALKRSAARIINVAKRHGLAISVEELGLDKNKPKLSLYTVRKSQLEELMRHLGINTVGIQQLEEAAESLDYLI